MTPQRPVQPGIGVAGGVSEREAAVVGGLRQRGVLVRAGGALGEAGALRITVGTEPENARLVRALADLLG